MPLYRRGIIQAVDLCGLGEACCATKYMHPVLGSPPFFIGGARYGFCFFTDVMDQYLQEFRSKVIKEKIHLRWEILLYTCAESGVGYIDTMLRLYGVQL